MTMLFPQAQDSPTYPGQAILDQTDLTALALSALGNGVLSGGGVAEQGSPDTTLSVDACSYTINYFEYLSDAVPSLDMGASDTFDRRDMIIIDDSESVFAITGDPCSVAGWTPSDSGPLGPVKPALANNQVMLFELYVPGGSTAYTTDMLTDKRLMIDPVLLLAGGTMAGPIDMDENPIDNVPTPTTDDQAANKGYVDSVAIGGPTPDYFYVVEDYGAVVDGKVTQDGSMTTGGSSTHLTCASGPFTSGDVGKTVTVAGAGAGGVVLDTTIASYVSPTVVHLTTGCSTSVTDAQVTYGTDDTAAWRDALAAAATAGGGIVYCTKTGISLLMAATVNHPFGANPGILNLPYNDNSNPEIFMPIGIEGPVPPSMPFSESTDTNAQDTGCLVLFCNSFGAQASTGGTATANVINAGNGTGSSFNGIQFIGRNFIVRTPGSSSYNAINLSWAEQCDLDGVYCDTNFVGGPNTVEPLGGADGIELPVNSNGAKVVVGSIGACGYNRGVVISEHCNAKEIAVGYCNIGMAAQAAYHSMQVDRLLSQWCGTHLASTDPVALGILFVDIDLFDVEDADGGEAAWMQTTYHLDDGANIMIGSCRFHEVLAGSGPVNTVPLINGGIYFFMENMGMGLAVWNTPTYDNSFTDAGGSATKFRKLRTSQVELQLCCTAPGSQLSPFTLPIGFRPGQTIDNPMTVYTGSAFEVGVLNIDSSGLVQLFNESAGDLTVSFEAFATIIFTAEN